VCVCVCVSRVRSCVWVLCVSCLSRVCSLCVCVCVYVHECLCVCVVMVVLMVNSGSLELFITDSFI